MNTMIKNTARILLENLKGGRIHFRRQEIIAKFGPTGMTEALGRKWLLVDDLYGYYTINHAAQIRAELEEAATCACGSKTCDCQDFETAEEASGQTLSCGIRKIMDAYVNAPSTSATGGPSVYHFSGRYTPGGGTVLPALPYRVGDDVSVTEDNVTYTGTIANVDSEGRIHVNWKGARPRRNRAYHPGEFLVNKKRQATTSA